MWQRVCFGWVTKTWKRSAHETGRNRIERYDSSKRWGCKICKEIKEDLSD